MSEREMRRRRSLIGVAAVVAVLALLLAVGVRQFVAQPYVIPSPSMRPTLQEGDVVLADRSSRGHAERGQIVVFDGRGYFGGPDSRGHYWAKRVIAVGGDHISCCNDAGQLVLNGKALAEPYLPADTDTATVPFDLEVPQGRLFLLGDNRTDSTDSRHLLGAPGGGMVPEDRVVGSVTRIVWPLDRSGQLPSIHSR